MEKLIGFLAILFFGTLVHAKVDVGNFVYVPSENLVSEVVAQITSDEFVVRSVDDRLWVFNRYQLVESRNVVGILRPNQHFRLPNNKTLYRAIHVFDGNIAHIGRGVVLDFSAMTAKSIDTKCIWGICKDHFLTDKVYPDSNFLNKVIVSPRYTELDKTVSIQVLKVVVQIEDILTDGTVLYTGFTVGNDNRTSRYFGPEKIGSLIPESFANFERARRKRSSWDLGATSPRFSHIDRGRIR